MDIMEIRAKKVFAGPGTSWVAEALVEGDVDGAKTLCDKLTGILAERNRICSVNK